MTDNVANNLGVKFYIHVYAPLSFHLNGRRLNLERGALFGPMTANEVDQVQRTSSNNSFRIVEDKAKSKSVEVREASDVPITIRKPIKISEPSAAEGSLIDELLKPVVISLNPTVKSVDQSMLPSVVPIGVESVTLQEYSEQPISIGTGETPRVLQDVVNANLSYETAQAVETKAKARSKKATTPIVEPTIDA